MCQAARRAEPSRMVSSSRMGSGIEHAGSSAEPFTASPQAELREPSRTN